MKQIRKVSKTSFETGGTITGETLPIGSMLPFGSATNIPSNWRICDGSEVSRTTYADLFNVIGTSYGEGDGETTFNLPNKKGRVSVGLDTSQDEFNTIGLQGGEKKVALTIDEMPSHSHSYTFDQVAYNKQAGTSGFATNTGGYVNESIIGFKGGDKPHNNLQPYEVDVWIIKVSNDTGVLEIRNAKVIDDLTSTSSTDALSANMGRELNNKIDNLELTGGSGSGNENYSTEEQVIGTWIDGKPIYRKSYQLSTGSSANTPNTISHGIENIALVTKLQGTCYWREDYSGATMIPYRNDDSDYCKLWVDLGYINVQSCFANRLAFVHIEYTKTTD